MESLLTEALDLARMGFKVFPLSKLSKIPLKNSRGFHDSTTDEAKILELFIEIEPLANIGISLIDTPYFVIDCDRNHKDGQDGIQSLLELSDGQSSLENAVTVKTANGGLHFYFKAPKDIEIKQQVGFKDGIDIITNFIVAPPSLVKRKDGTIGAYELVSGSLEAISECPSWLLREITSKQQPQHLNGSYMLDFNDKVRIKKYTAILLEEIVQGVDKSQRNVWLTKITGKLLYLGMGGKEAYELLLVINEKFIRPSLSDKEFNTTFTSVLKLENRKVGNNL